MTSQALYEEAAVSELGNTDAFWNGLREHMDRFSTVCQVIFNLHPLSVLDLGCHLGMWGQLIRWQHQPKKYIVGVDIAPTCVEHAVQKMGYDRGVVHDLTQEMKTIDGPTPFDLVLCMEILEHVTDPQAVLHNARIHARQHLICSVPVERGKEDGIYHVRRVEVNQLEHWVRKAGFAIQECRFIPSRFCEKPHWDGWILLKAEVA